MTLFSPLQIFLLSVLRNLVGKYTFSSPAKKIKVKKNNVEGIEIEKKGLFSAKYVISNADATQTFLFLIEKKFISRDIISKLKNLEPSLSMFILYLGLNEYLNSPNNLHPHTNIWFLPSYDINKMYNLAIKGDIDNLDYFLVRLLSDSKSMLMLVLAPFKDKTYWEINKKRLIDVFIRKIEQVIPDISSHIVFKDAATPNTLYKWTLNYKGAAYGWAGIPSQLAVTGFTQRTIH